MSSTLEHYANLLENCYDFPPSKYVKELNSLQGLQCLVSEIQVASGAHQTHLAEILGLVLNNPRLVCSCAVDDLTQTLNLFCGSRLLTVTSSTSLDKWFCNGTRYAKWLAYQLLEFQNPPAMLLDRACKLGFDIYEVLFTDFGKFLNCYASLSQNSKAFVLRSWLKFTTLKAPSIAAILKQLAFDPLKTIYIAQRLNVQVQRAAAICPSDLPAIVPILLEDWGSTINITQSTIPLQTAQTQILLSIATQLSPQEALAASRLEAFSHGVSNHLTSESTLVREMGTIVAQVYARQAGEKLSFDLDYEHSYFISKEEIVPIEEAFEPVTESANNAQDYLAPLEKAPSKEDVPMDSDDEDDDNTEPPVYVRDLLSYLHSSEYGKHHSALTSGPDLIRRKAKYGSELTHYAPELLALIAGLSDQYSVADFAKKRQECLVALIVADPSLAEKVVHLLNQGDYSLSQRISLMNALVEAAQQLAQFKAPAFATPQLPGTVHTKFYSEQDLTTELNGLLLNAPSERPSINMFSKLAASFFYPLAALRAKEYGDYTVLIYQHWLKTLGLIVYYSYPSNDIPGMTTQLLGLLVSARATAPEAVYVCLLLLVDVAPAVLLRSPLVLDLREWCSSWQSQSDPKIQKMGATAYYKLSKLLQDAQQKMLGTLN